jgi:hypothetical protein
VDLYTRALAPAHTLPLPPSEEGAEGAEGAEEGVEGADSSPEQEQGQEQGQEQEQRQKQGQEQLKRQRQEQKRRKRLRKMQKQVPRHGQTPPASRAQLVDAVLQCCAQGEPPTLYTLHSMSYSLVSSP